MTSFKRKERIQIEPILQKFIIIIIASDTKLCGKKLQIAVTIYSALSYVLLQK